MGGRWAERRGAVGLAILAGLAAALALVRVPLADRCELWLLQPAALVLGVLLPRATSVAHAAPVVAPGAAPDSGADQAAAMARDAAVVARLLDATARAALAAGAAAPAGELARVVAVGGKGGGGVRPATWRLDLVADPLRHRAGDPVVAGDVLVGRLEPPHSGAPLSVAALHFLPEAPQNTRPPWRVLVVAKPLGSELGAEEQLRAALEPASPSDPYPLRLIQPDRPQTRTWLPGHEFLASTLALELPPVGPELGAGSELPPAGLRVGRVRTRGYRDPDFVLDWFVEPEIDPRLLHTVAILGATPPPPTPEVPAHEAAARHLGAQGDWIDAVWLGTLDPSGVTHTVLVRSAVPLRVGCAVLLGWRVLGTVERVLGELACVRPFADAKEPWPALFWADPHQAPIAVLLQPRRVRAGRCECTVLARQRAADDAPEPGAQSGVLFSGPLGPDLPFGLVIGEAELLAPDLLAVTSVLPPPRGSQVRAFARREVRP